MNIAALLVDLAGLSHREASDVFKIRLDTVQGWYRKHRPSNASPRLLAEIKALITQEENLAAETLDHIQKLLKTGAQPEYFDVEYPADDHEAEQLGLPCVGAWRAMAARVISQSPIPIKLVPKKNV